MHALLGENGAGKSTLIKIVSCVYPPSSGEMQVDGKTVHFAHPREAQAHGIATIYQEFSLYPELTVAENIFSGNMPRTMGGLVLDWGRAERRQRRFWSLSMPLTLMCDPASALCQSETVRGWR